MVGIGSAGGGDVALVSNKIFVFRHLQAVFLITNQHLDGNN